MLTLDDIHVPEPRESKLLRKASSRPTSTWPAPADEFIGMGLSAEEAEAVRVRYNANKHAVTKYAEGVSEQAALNDVLKVFKLKLAHGTVYKLYQRCLRTNPATQDICGFWGCVPHWRPKVPGAPRTLNKRHNLSSLFARYPQLEAHMCEFVRRRKTDGMLKVAALTPWRVWKVFLALCRRLQLHTLQQWPFNDDLKGYEAIRRWYRQEKYKSPSAAARNHLPKDMAQAVAADQRAAALPAPAVTIAKAYSQVQLDEHLSHEMWLPLLPGLHDDEWIAGQPTRVWAIAAVEIQSKAILSSSLALQARYDSRDVLRTLLRAVLPPPRFTKLRIQDEEWGYDEGAAYPAELDELRMNSWQHLSMDGHGTHISSSTQRAIESVLRCLVHIGPPGTPQVRSVMEYFFKQMASQSGWFPSSVGNGPNSPERRDPETGALLSLMYLPLAEEYWDLRCRNYNVSYRPELDATPLADLQRRAKRGEIFHCPVGAFGKGNLHQLLPKDVRTLKFKRVAGYGVVYVNFGYTYYTGPELSKAFDLMSQSDLSVTIYVQEDARFAFVVPHAFPDRVYRVVCGGRFRQNPHTLEHRLFVCRNAKSKYFASIASGALLEVGALRGLSRAVSSDAARAQLLGGFYAFMDRYGAGVVSNVDMSADDVARLLDFEVGAVLEDRLADEAMRPGAELAAGAAALSATPAPPVDPYGLFSDAP